MHNKQNRRIFVIKLFSAPIQRNMPSVVKEYFLSLKLVRKERLVNIVNRLKERMREVGSWPVLVVIFIKILY